MPYRHFKQLSNLNSLKNHLTAVPFNGTCFIEEVGCNFTAQQGSSCGLNCDSPSPKKCPPVLTPGACESDLNLFGIRIFADILRASLVAQRVKNPPAVQETQVQPLGWEIPWRREWLPTPVFLPGESHGQRSLGGYSRQGCKESDTTEQLPYTHKMGSYWIEVDPKSDWRSKK